MTRPWPSTILLFSILSGMAKPPRKSSSPSQDTPDSVDDPFAGEIAPVPEGTIIPEDLPEEWLLDDADVAAHQPAPKPRSGMLSSLPGSSPTPSGRLFESDHEASLPPMALPLPEPKSKAETKPTPAKPSHALESKPTAAPKPEPEPEPPLAVLVDPFHIDDELPSVPQRPPIIEDEPEADPPPIVFADDGSESAEKPSPGELKKTGLLVAGILTLAVLGVFCWIVYSGLPESAEATALSKPSLPMKGQVVTVTEATSGWRARQKDDLISIVEVFLPAPSREQAALVPQVKFTIDPASTKNGFIRFIFFNGESRISGDVRILSVGGGTMQPMISGALIEGANATVYGSVGFMDRPGFVGYATDESTRWFVEISESTDYNAKESGWTRLQTFNIKDSSAP